MPKLPKPKTKTNSVRGVVYPDVKCTLYLENRAITTEVAKKLLGWQEVESGHDFIDFNGKKIKCFNNVTNRPLYQSVVTTLKQEHLRKRWLMNGEPIIIGKTGFVLNGQHQLIALIFAGQEWEADKEKWEEWESEPTMAKLVVFGIDEGDSVVNTMDTCKPRTLTDAIYRSEFFADMPKDRERKIVARILDFAVKMLWHRTGADSNAFAPRRTHSEALIFIARHPKILECVKHIYEEDGDNKQVGKYLSTGYAAGMLYLMGCCKSDKVQDYLASPNEDLLDWSTWEEACEFWVNLASGDKKLSAVREALKQMIEDNGGSRPERTALIVKAWLAYVNGGNVTPKMLALEYSDDDNGFRTLTETPIVGGIDIGSPQDQTVDPTPEELEERMSSIRQEKDAKKAGSKKPKSKKTKSDVEVGMQVWVEEEGGHWTGEVAEIYDGPNGPVAKIKCKNKKVFEEAVENCLTTEPTEVE
jgi:hypothetical protein